MPYEVTRLEPQVYHAVWSSPLTIHDMSAASQEVEAYADQYDEPYYVVISDFEHCGSMPLDVNGLRAMDSYRMVGIVTVAPPMIARIAADVIRLVFSNSILKSATTLDAAYEMCHELLASHHQKTTS
jgi:hypothetical protein